MAWEEAVKTTCFGDKCPRMQLEVSDSDNVALTVDDEEDDSTLVEIAELETTGGSVTTETIVVLLGWDNVSANTFTITRMFFALI